MIKLSYKEAEEIREKFKAGGHQGRLAIEYGVSRQTISNICTGRSRLPGNRFGRKPVVLTRKMMRQLLYASVEEVAKIYKVSNDSIYRALKARGLWVRNLRMTRENLERLLDAPDYAGEDVTSS